jgi:hypothetical protein
MEKRAMTHEHDHDTVVVDSGGSNMGAILGVLGVIILLIAVWYFALGPGTGTTNNTTNNDNDIINPPAVSAAPPAESSAP